MGVKSLWSLLTPVGRPIMLETFEGKVMAIDSSIWIYQFQATMRDKEGHALLNAHILGFLRRISKLLFYGIKPVFVFDGGAPVLKMSTLNERRSKKSGAAASHAKIAEKLLAAQLRREALGHVQGSKAGKTPKGKGKATEQDDNTVYLEDINPTMQKTPARRQVPDAGPSSTSSRKNKSFDRDPYNLPDVDLEAQIAKAAQSVMPDPRLATEDELRSFIEEMRPEDFDVNSPEFRELPTEVQYEIVGDLRLKSRQTSYARLQNMLKNAATPLDFSKQQIKNLRQRNSLTQQLLTTTDTIGSAHISIPVRIASERNREYVLVKNEGASGGWILGIRDKSGTLDKPIEIDHDEEEAEIVQEDSDAEMEEVDVSATAIHDADLREYRREMALSAIADRYTPKKLAPLTTKPIDRKTKKSKPLFEPDDEDELPRMPVVSVSDDEDVNEDTELAFAIQASLDQAKMMKESRLSVDDTESSHTRSTKPSHLPVPRYTSDDEDLYASPTRLETALSIANARPFQSPGGTFPRVSLSSTFGRPVLPSSSRRVSQVAVDSEDELEEVTPQLPPQHVTLNESPRDTQPQKYQVTEPKPVEPQPTPPQNLEPLPTEPQRVEHQITKLPSPQSKTPEPQLQDPMSPQKSDSDDDMEEITPTIVSQPNIHDLPTNMAEATAIFVDSRSPSPPIDVQATPQVTIERDTEQAEAGPSRPPLFHPPPDDEEDEPLSGWSRSPSPFAGPSGENDGMPPPPSAPAAESWDAAQEMDAQAEEGEFVRFMSQVKGKGLADARREVDDEIETLNQQRKAAARDSEDISQHTIAQIMMMLRLFGIPYITAPMEAEAQCAELMALSLVDGVITDDSDVFLFGAQRVFKNMFNQSKTVECFLLPDLARELGLDRDTLIRLAYLLGSDYTEGLPGIGPVVAMELLREFPGENGLHDFRDWWLKVQTGKDREEDNRSTFRKRFKKKFKKLYLPSDWPNAAVKDAYYHPTVDSSDEPFKWGLPDLDALREFLRDEIGWHQDKVNELLLPIVQKMNKRGQAAAMNRQGNLNDFFDIAAGSGTFAPRKRQAYASKRLQKVVADFRKRGNGGQGSTVDSDSQQESDGELPVPVMKKRKTTRKGARGEGDEKRDAEGDELQKGGGAEKTKANSKAKPRKAQVKAKAKRGKAGKGKGKEDSSSDQDEFMVGDADGEAPPIAVQLRPRPKPRPAYKGANEIEIESD